LILRAFAAADEFKSARSLASSVRLKAQTKLIADPEGGSKPAGKPATLRVSEAVENAALIDAGAAGRARDGQGL